MQDSPEVGKSGRKGLVSRVRRVGNKSGSPEESVLLFHHSYIICSSVLIWREASGEWRVGIGVLRC